MAPICVLISFLVTGDNMGHTPIKKEREHELHTNSS